MQYTYTLNSEISDTVELKFHTGQHLAQANISPTCAPIIIIEAVRVDLHCDSKLS